MTPPWWPVWAVVVVLALVLGAAVVVGRRRDARAAVRAAAAARTPRVYWAVRGEWAGDAGPFSTRLQHFTIAAEPGEAPDLSSVLEAQPGREVMLLQLQPWPENGSGPVWPGY
jgi:hypothetical protein